MISSVDSLSSQKTLMKGAMRLGRADSAKSNQKPSKDSFSLRFGSVGDKPGILLTPGGQKTLTFFERFYALSQESAQKISTTVPFQADTVLVQYLLAGKPFDLDSLSKDWDMKSLLKFSGPDVVEHLQEVAEACAESGNIHDAIALHEVGIILHKGMNHGEKAFNGYHIGNAHNRLGVLYTLIGDTRKAEGSLAKALELFGKTENRAGLNSRDEIGLLETMANLGKFYLAKGNTSVALHYFDRATQRYSNEGQVHLDSPEKVKIHLQILFNTAWVYENLPAAKICLETFLELNGHATAMRVGAPESEIKKIHSMLSEIYSGWGQLDEAKAHFELAASKDLAQPSKKLSPAALKAVEFSFLLPLAPVQQQFLQGQATLDEFKNWYGQYFYPESIASKLEIIADACKLVSWENDAALLQQAATILKSAGSSQA